MSIRAPQGHSGNNLDFSTFSHEKIEKSYAPLVCHIVFLGDDDSITSGGLVSGGVGTSRGRNFSLASPLAQNPNPKYKPYFHLKTHHDLLFMIDLDAAQNFAGSLPNSERECLMLRRSPGRVPHQDHQHQRWIRRVRESGIKRKRSIRRDRNALRETSGHESQDQETLQTRHLGRS